MIQKKNTEIAELQIQIEKLQKEIENMNKISTAAERYKYIFLVKEKNKKKVKEVDKVLLNQHLVEKLNN